MKPTTTASFWLLSGVGRVAKKFFGRPVEVSFSGPLRILRAQDVKLQNVYGRWLKVLDLIIEGEGSDDLVEARRGKLFSVPSEEAEVLDEVEEDSADGDLSPEALEALEHSPSDV